MPANQQREAAEAAIPSVSKEIALDASAVTAYHTIWTMVVKLAHPRISFWCSHDSLCEQNTPNRRTERQWGLNSHFAFLGWDTHLQGEYYRYGSEALPLGHAF
ncbi:hypothetical protein F4X88_07465 [Candidatus Poribacteria bacterium]|nr:hypothetical protein [Candidatus Poribacteria bacterium]